MAISDLSVFISTEQDVQLNKKDSAKGSAVADKESAESDFFSQLQSANNIAETPVKVNLIGAESPVDEAEVVAEKAQEIPADNSDEDTMTGDAMLAQIVAANNTDTRVNSTPTVENSQLLAKLGKYSAEKIDPKLVTINGSRPIDGVTPIIDTDTPATDDAVPPVINDIQVVKETSQNKEMAMQPTIQQAVATPTTLQSGQVGNDAAQIIAAKTVKGVASSSQTDVPAKAAKQSKHSNSSTALEQISKVLLNSTTTVQKNENPLLASLTPEQQKQLQTQVDVIRQQGATTANVTDLKQMLAEFVELNSKDVAKPSAVVATMNTAELTQLSKDIALLSPVQKQALSQQLQNFVSTEQPKGALLTQINKVIAELAQPESTEKLIASKAQLTVQSMTDNLATTATTTSRNTTLDTNKVSAPQNEFIKAASKEQEVKLAVQDSALKSEQFAENIKAEQSQVRDNSLTRINQLFGQITGLTTAAATAPDVEKSEQRYQQALADMQVMHAQQASPVSQIKQVNIDPTVLQALNIMKSDAAKLLQERVSALLSINNKEAEIRLDPPEMGSMQIRIRSDAEQAHINFVVQNQQAKEALEQSMPRLREMLAQQGIELGESSIQQGNSQSDTGGDGQQNGRGQQANQQQNEEESALTQQPIRGSGQQSSSAIDYYA
ncbi:flagellar hook-length control protein FliK [Pseudoalteromonas arctica]|uniref:Flagellar hook-length control protein FliK n=1 Tax=Pseudoalteromonas arctica TaxID=394751 RepID=A0A7Y0DR89_9GAMM|nr:flagellar hook-length control protein FliK [Pseudoalteromonas arctica]NMM40187.1 flagellar hook-length control protein FliK [Pseudoalteromonas arctica]